MQSSVDLIAFNVPFSAASQDPPKVFLTAEVNTTEAWVSRYQIGNIVSLRMKEGIV